MIRQLAGDLEGGFCSLEELRARIRSQLPQGSKMLERPEFWTAIKTLLSDPSPVEAVVVGEWLQRMSVSEGYAGSRDRQLAKFDVFVQALPRTLQGEPTAVQLSWFVGREALRRKVRSPATVETYTAQVASALGTSRRAKVVASALEGMRRLWMFSPMRAIPVGPEQAYAYLPLLPSLACRMLGVLWISNGLRQGDLARMLAQDTKVEAKVSGAQGLVLVSFLQRKGNCAGRGSPSELVLPVATPLVSSLVFLLRRIFQAPLVLREGWLETLVLWRSRLGLQAHSFRRGTAQWLSAMQVEEDTIASILGHSEAVRKHPVTQLYTDGLSLADRLRKASALPLPWSPT